MSEPTDALPSPRRDRHAPTRRAVIGAATALAVGTIWGGSPRAQEAEPAPDPRLSVDTVTFQVRKQVFKGYLARTKVGAKRPGILLIPDQRGPNPFWRALARRYAMDGFIVLVPDLLAPYNMPQEGSDEGVNLMARIIPAEQLLVLDAAADLLAKHPECNGAVAAVGFVWGGPYAMLLAINGSKVKAAVIHYATLPSPERAAQIKVPVQFHWVDNDPRTAPQIEAMEKRMIGAARVFESWIYPGVSSGFASDSLSRAYNKEAADRAFDRTVFFLKRHLGG